MAEGGDKYSVGARTSQSGHHLAVQVARTVGRSKAEESGYAPCESELAQSKHGWESD